MADRDPAKIMTKAEARRLARQVTGYISPGEPGMHAADYAMCPLCRGQVSLANRPYPRSLHEPSRIEMDAALMLHLLDQYDDSRCPRVAVVRPGSEL